MNVNQIAQLLTVGELAVELHIATGVAYKAKCALSDADYRVHPFTEEHAFRDAKNAATAIKRRLTSACKKARALIDAGVAV